MSPVIRIDDEVMEELKRQAVRLGLVFEPPNTVLRAILQLNHARQSGPKILNYNNGSESIEIVINKIHSAYQWALIPIPRDKRAFFPGYKIMFELVTDIGTITTHVTSADVKGTPPGDPNGGKYIQTHLRDWFGQHPKLKDGSILRFETIEKGRRYRLSVISNSYSSSDHE